MRTRKAHKSREINVPTNRAQAEQFHIQFENVCVVRFSYYDMSHNIKTHAQNAKRVNVSFADGRRVQFSLLAFSDYKTKFTRV